MQFHLDGFRPGDPAIADAAAALPPPAPDRELPAAVDVLIVGSGPTGLLLAAQLARFTDISTCVVEAKPGPLRLGQADGIACRSMEMFHAFGFADRIMAEAYWVNETVFWKPDPAAPGTIRRSDRIQDVEDGLSEFPHVILNQARVHDLLLEMMRNSPTGLVPHYSRRLVDLETSPEAGVPTIARFERPGADDAVEVETVRARYVVGCDGARSTVRRSIGRELVGDAANQAWGVMDVLAVTDFPDIRFKAIIHSSDEGNMLVIPREGGYLVRLYIELDVLGAGERVADRGITVERLVDQANRILRPYTIDVHEVAWWSVYEIGQRITDKYDDAPPGAGSGRLPKVFIAGDACHTHSPKAGQGMNVSMRDAYNLGWKLAAVLRGRATPELLHSYSAERRDVAQELIDFDRELAKMFSARPKTSPHDTEGVDPEEFQAYFQQHGRFTAGVATRYRPSELTGDGTHQHLASGFQVGTRLHSARVVRLGDGKPMHLGHVHEADGRWRVYAFADGRRPDADDSRLAAWCTAMSHDPRSPLLRYTPDDADPDSVIDVRGILQQSHRDVEIGDLPSLLRPRKGRYGLVDYQKAFCPDFVHGPDIFDERSIDRTDGAVLLVRPDQHIADVVPLDAIDALADRFDRLMLPVR